MPIYEYICAACGAQTEVMHKISDPPARDCPACAAPALTKLVSAAGFRLSGGGWYETDFKSANKRNVVNDSGDGGAKSGEGAACSPAGCEKPACAAKAEVAS